MKNIDVNINLDQVNKMLNLISVYARVASDAFAEADPVAASAFAEQLGTIFDMDDPTEKAYALIVFEHLTGKRKLQLSE